LKTKYSKASGTGDPKAPKTLSGIEIVRHSIRRLSQPSRPKAPKTLSGIEIQALVSVVCSTFQVQNHLKPYQGLKCVIFWHNKFAPSG
jgi:hypothetical protein